MDNLTEMEYTVVGTMLVFPLCIGQVLETLAPEDFSSEAARGLFCAIAHLHGQGAPIDRVAVLHEAGEEYRAAIDAMEGYCTRDIDYYCKALKERSRLFSIQSAAMGVARAGSLDEAHKQLDALNALMSARRGVRIVPIADAVADFCTRMTEKAPDYLKWGFKALDEGLFVELGDFVVIGGHRTAGKTLLSLQFARVLSEKYRVGYFSIETGENKLTDRLMAHAAGIPLGKIKRRDLGDGEWQAVRNVSGPLSKRKLDFIPCSGATVRDISAVSLSRRYQVIFVDYLQNIESSGQGMYERVTAISRGLHNLAQGSGIAVIALAQLSRPRKDQKGNYERPTLSSFRESGQIEQDADVAMLLYPSDPKDNDSPRVLDVAKNKEGRQFSIKLDFSGATQTLSVHRPDIAEALQDIKKAAKAAKPQLGFEDISDNAHVKLPF